MSDIAPNSASRPEPPSAIGSEATSLRESRAGVGPAPKEESASPSGSSAHPPPPVQPTSAPETLAAHGIRVRGWLVAAALAAVLTIAALVRSADTLPLFCLFRKVTTLPCPSCGMTHAFVAMGHGHWTDAWHANLAGPILYAVGWLALGLALAQGLSGRDVLAGLWRRTRRLAVPAVVVLMAVAWVENLLRRFAE